MAARKRVGIGIVLAIFLFVCAGAFFAGRESRNPVFNPIAGNIYRERTLFNRPVASGPNAFPMGAIHIMHLRGITLEEVVQRLEPGLRQSGYLKSRVFNPGLVSFSKRASGNYSYEVDICDGTVYGLPGVLIVDIRDATPMQTVMQRITSFGRNPSSGALRDGSDFRRALGE